MDSHIHLRRIVVQEPDRVALPLRVCQQIGRQTLSAPPRPDDEDPSTPDMGGTARETWPEAHEEQEGEREEAANRNDRERQRPLPRDNQVTDPDDERAQQHGVGKRADILRPGVLPDAAVHAVRIVQERIDGYDDGQSEQQAGTGRRWDLAVEAEHVGEEVRERDDQAIAEKGPAVEAKPLGWM
jgi:hypothetical protein